MRKYRLKMPPPPVIEAYQFWPYTQDNPGVIKEESGGQVRWYVPTAHGERAYLTPGDYVVTEPGGQYYYLVSPVFFEASYDPID